MLYLALIALPVLLVCVIAYFWRRRARAVAAPEPAATLEDLAQMAAPCKLVVGYEGENLLTIERFTAPADACYQSLPINQRIRAGLRVLLQPAAELAAQQGEDDLYLLTLLPRAERSWFSQEESLQEAFAAGVFGLSREDAGQIVRKAMMKPMAKPDPALASTALWQMIALATANPFLPMADRQITAGKSLGTTASKEDAQGETPKRLAALRHLHNLLSHFELELAEVPAHRDRLFEAQRAALAAIEAGLPDLEACRQNWQELKLSGPGIKEHFEEAQACLANYQTKTEIIVHALATLAASAFLHCALPLPRLEAMPGLKQLEASIQAVAECTASCTDAFNKRLPELKSLFSTKKTHREFQNKLHAMLAATLEEVEQTLQGLLADCAGAEKIVEAQTAAFQAEMRFAAILDKTGEILSLRQVM